MSSPQPPFRLFMGGAEIPGWKKLLEEQNAAMSVSFWALYHRRLPKIKPYLLEDRFAGDYPLLLESGGHSVNSGKSRAEQVTRGRLLAYAERYEQFVADNIDRLTLVTEFDALPLGREWVEERRRAFYDTLPPKKVVAVWHEDWGMDMLQNMAQRYDVIGVSSTIQKSGRNLTPVLNGLVRSGIRLHGIGLTKGDDLRAVNFSSASSTSWLSPGKYGDTVLWDGNRLHVYPMKYKERARSQNKTKIEKAGFDADLIMADNTPEARAEVLRLSIWSWQQQATALQARRQNTTRPALDPFSVETVTDTYEEEDDLDDDATGENTSVTIASESSNRHPVPSAPRIPVLPTKRETIIRLPVFDTEAVTSEETDEEGHTIISAINVVKNRPKSGRVCDNCYVSDVCPLFQPGAECAYEIPQEAHTKEQRTALMNGFIAMQAQRVEFLRFGEELNGGQADPNLSVELDRLFKLMAKQAEIEDDRDFFEASFKGRAKTGTFANLFGRDPEIPRAVGKARPTMDPMQLIQQALND